MKRAARRIDVDNFDFLETPEFVLLCRGNNHTAFTRKRKLTYEDVVCSVLVNTKKSSVLEVHNFMDKAHPDQTITKQGYLKDRLKLNPLAFKALYEFHNKSFYSDAETEKYTLNGFYMLAGDGSNVNIPTTPENLQKYGNASPGPEARPQAQLKIECLYDTMNRMILDAAIAPWSTSEMGLVEPMIYRAHETIGEDAKFVIILDRGYPDTAAMLRMMDAGIYFIVRLKKSTYKKEQQSMTSNDEDVDIALTYQRKYVYKGTSDEAAVSNRDSFRLRMVRAPREDDDVNTDDEVDDNYAIFATNLPRDLFPEESFYEYYYMRWNIETDAFRQLKSHLQLENFTGTKSVLIEQDIYSTIYLSNITEDIAHDAELDQKDHLKNDYKHPMDINRSVEIGLLKNRIIDIVLEPDAGKRKRIYDQLYKRISENIEPVRPERHYKRNKAPHMDKYSNTYKPDF